MAYGLTNDKIRVGSELHDRIRDNRDKRFTASAQRIDRLHLKWRQSEDTFLCFMPEREADAARRATRESGGKPQYTTLVLPYSYAMLMSAHSYWTTVFLGRNPIFQYTGRHGESQHQVQAIEALIDYQVTVGNNLVPLYLWLLDPGKFGIGIIGQYWDEEQIPVSEYVDQQQSLLGIPIGTPKRELVTRLVPGFSGSRLYNVRPYDWYPDPRVALWEVQKGEFCGCYREVGWNTIVRGAVSGQYTNVDYLRKMRKEGRAGAVAREQGSPRVELPNDNLYTVSQWDLEQTGPYGILEMYVEVIPNEWGLGSSTYPEKWCFTATVSAGTATAKSQRGNVDLVIGARPLGAFHGKFPFHVIEMEPEAYAFSSRSMLEITQPLQNAMDWLFNAHMYNVRKVLNDQLVVDPSRIVMGDLLDPLPGGIIRAKPAGYGSDLSTAVRQLHVVDITRSHITDMEVVHQISQRAVGVTDQLMGMFQGGGRRTATETRTSSTFGVNRQKTIAEYMSAMGFAPLGQMLVQLSQQYYTAELKMRIAGDLMLEAGQAVIDVNPEQIAGSYDMVPVDGTLPIDRYAQANLWRELMIGIRQMPEIAMQYDMGRIFAWVAQVAGLKNITRFRVDVQPDAMALQQARMGNLVQMQPRRARGPGASGATSPEVGQVSGMGATG